MPVEPCVGHAPPGTADRSSGFGARTLTAAVMLCFDLLYFVLLCFALLCFALLTAAASLPPHNTGTRAGIMHKSGASNLSSANIMEAFMRAFSHFHLPN
jgi:hypothetical protein